MSYNKDITLDYLKNNPFTVYDDVAWENKSLKHLLANLNLHLKEL